jgi:hypothetical protein
MTASLDRLAEAMNRARRRMQIHLAHERLLALETRLAEVEGGGGLAEDYPATFWIRQRRPGPGRGGRHPTY